MKNVGTLGKDLQYLKYLCNRMQQQKSGVAQIPYKPRHADGRTPGGFHCIWDYFLLLFNQHGWKMNIAS